MLLFYRLSNSREFDCVSVLCICNAFAHFPFIVFLFHFIFVSVTDYSSSSALLMIDIVVWLARISLLFIYPYSVDSKLSHTKHNEKNTKMLLWKKCCNRIMYRMCRSLIHLYSFWCFFAQISIIWYFHVNIYHIFSCRNTKKIL